MQVVQVVQDREEQNGSPRILERRLSDVIYRALHADNYHLIRTSGQTRDASSDEPRHESCVPQFASSGPNRTR